MSKKTDGLPRLKAKKLLAKLAKVGGTTFKSPLVRIGKHAWKPNKYDWRTEDAKHAEMLKSASSLPVADVAAAPANNSGAAHETG